MISSTGNGTLDGILDRGLQFATLFSKNGTTTQQALNNPPKQTASSQPAWLTPVLIGVGLLVVVLVGFTMFGKK